MNKVTSGSDVEDTEIAVVIVNYRTTDLALSCLQAVAAERRSLPRLRAVMVDGNSGDGSAERLARAFQAPQLATWGNLILLPINGGFGWANNQAILNLLKSDQPPEFIHLLNPDTVPHPGAILALVRCLQLNVRAAAVGSQLLDPDGSPSGSAFPFPTAAGEFARGARTGIIDHFLAERRARGATPGEVDWVTGASVMLRSSALREVGLFDDGFFLYHEEVELMARLRKAGWSIIHEPRSHVVHIGGAATGHKEGSSGANEVSRRPSYWYESRRRYFSLTGGKFAAVMALGLWLAGHLIFRLTRVLRRKVRKLVAHELSDQLRYGLPIPLDFISAVTEVSGPSGTPPAWMRLK